MEEKRNKIIEYNKIIKEQENLKKEREKIAEFDLIIKQKNKDIKEIKKIIHKKSNKEQELDNRIIDKTNILNNEDYNNKYELNNKNKIIYNQNLNNISFNSTLNIDIPTYSFDYNTLLLTLYNIKGNNKIISFIIKNNGINQWIMNKTFLKIRKNEYLSNEIIKLSELKPNEFQEINLILKEEKIFDIGIIHLIFDFIVENKIFGEPLYIDIENYQKK